MFITLRASEGHIITDGENYAKTFDLAENKSDENYYEITNEEYERIMAEQISSEE